MGAAMLWRDVQAVAPGRILLPILQRLARLDFRHGCWCAANATRTFPPPPTASRAGLADQAPGHLTRGLKTGAGTRHFVGLMARGRV